MIYQHIYAIIFVHVDHALRVVMSVHKSHRALRSACGALASASFCGTLWSSSELVGRQPGTRRNFRLLKTPRNSPNSSELPGTRLE